MRMPGVVGGVVDLGFEPVLEESLGEVDSCVEVEFVEFHWPLVVVVRGGDGLVDVFWIGFRRATLSIKLWPLVRR